MDDMSSEERFNENERLRRDFDLRHPFYTRPKARVTPAVDVSKAEGASPEPSPAPEPDDSPDLTPQRAALAALRAKSAPLASYDLPLEGLKHPAGTPAGPVMSQAEDEAMLPRPRPRTSIPPLPPGTAERGPRNILTGFGPEPVQSKPRYVPPLRQPPITGTEVVQGDAGAPGATSLGGVQPAVVPTDGIPESLRADKPVTSLPLDVEAPAAPAPRPVVAKAPAPAPKPVGSVTDEDAIRASMLPPDAAVAAKPPAAPPGAASDGPKKPSEADLLEFVLNRQRQNQPFRYEGLYRALEGMNSALTQKPADYSLSKRIREFEDAEANRPLAEYAQDAKVREMRREETARDPASAENLAFFDSLPASLQQAFANARGKVTRADLQNIASLYSPIAKNEAAAAAAKAKMEGAASLAEMREAGADRRAREANAARMAAARIKADSVPAEKPMTPATKASVDKFKTQRLTDLGKVVDIQNDFASVMKEMETAVPGIKEGKAENMPGAVERYVASLGGIGQQFASKHANNVVQLQNRIAALLGKKDSGLVLNEQEVKRLNDFLGLGAGAPPEQFVAAYNLIRKALHQSIKNRNSTFGQTNDPDIDRFAVLDTYKSVNPTMIDEDDPLFAGAAQAPAEAPKAAGGTVRVIGPDGKIGTIPRENMEKAKARGYREAT